MQWSDKSMGLRCINGLILLTILLVSTKCFAAPYRYYLGPWVWTTESGESFWSAPSGTVGMVDLRSNTQQSIPINPQGVGFFATNNTLSADYVFLGEGYISTVVVDDSIKDAWFAKTGYRPNGNTLLDLLWDQLTVGSDPNGDLNVMPLMPEMNGDLTLHLEGHSLVRKEHFVYGVHPHTLKVRDALRNVYRKERQESIKRGNQNYRKILDLWREKYGVKNPQVEFIPNDLPKETPLPHNTTLTDNFNRADADAMGTASGGFTWNEYNGDIDIVSNRAKQMTLNAGFAARAESALSSADQYAQVSVVVQTGGSGTAECDVGVIARSDNSSPSTHYHARHVDGGGTFIGLRFYKDIAGTLTQLSTQQSTDPALPYTLRMEVNGSNMKSLAAGTTYHNFTDTAITSGSYTGVRAFQGSAATPGEFDDFESGDLVTTIDKVFQNMTVTGGLYVN